MAYFNVLKQERCGGNMKQNPSKCAANYVISFEVYDDLIGQKILKLWRRESWPFGPGWAAHITRIRSCTFRLPCKDILLTTSRASDSLNKISLDIFEKIGTLFRKFNFSSIFFIPVCIIICWNTPRSNVHTSPGLKAKKIYKT